jgi:high-affinity nickel permease
MLMFGIRHALDVVHITAIDNLVILHDAKKGSWLGRNWF